MMMQEDARRDLYIYAGSIFCLEKKKRGREPVGTGSEAGDPAGPHAVEETASEQARGCHVVQGPHA